MKIRVDNSRNTLGVSLEEHESVLIGRCPPESKTTARIVIEGGGAFDYLSNHALTIRNSDDRMVIENEQRATSGRVFVVENSQWRPVERKVPKTIHPMPTSIPIKIELFGQPGDSLIIHVRASGIPLAAVGVRTRDAYADDAVLDDWVLALNAVECNRRQGGKTTAKDAKWYFLHYKGLPDSDTRAFETAYRTAAEILTGDRKCSHEFLLSRAGNSLNERLIKRLREIPRS